MPNNDEAMIVWYFWLLQVVLEVEVPNGITLQPPLLLTLSVAHCVHILVTLYQEMRAGSPKAEAIVESLRINMQPVFVTSATTAIGFLVLNFSDTPPFQKLGNMVGFGMMMAFVFVMVNLVVDVTYGFIDPRIRYS